MSRRIERTARCALESGAAGAMLLAAACAPGAPEPADNVILITLDTTRADVLSCYGGSERATPNLGAFAARALTFDVARSVAPLTVPAHASMLTGLVPPRHGVRDNGVSRLPSSAETLAERARASGLETAAFVSALVLDHGFGLDQGFDTYAQPARPASAASNHYVSRRAEDTLAQTIAWLDARDRTRHFFLWVHLFDPHVPYAPPPEALELAGGDPYRGEVAYVDRELGRLFTRLEELDLFDSSLVVVVGDHGESLGEHGEATHSAFCYDATLRVPLLVRFPDGRGAGERSSSVVSVVDVFPTALAALGLDAGGAHDGFDLARAVPAERAVYCESYAGWYDYGWSPLAGVADANGKYLASSAPEFFDLRVDPRELRDRAAERRADVAAARARLAEFLARPALAPEPLGASVERSAWLRELGYGPSVDAASAPPSPLAPSDRPSPASRRDELAALLAANAALETRRLDEAARRLGELLQANPKHALAHDLAAITALELGDFARARELLLARLALGGDSADTRINLALACERLGDDACAETAWQRACELDPESARAADGLAALLERTGRAEAARKVRAAVQSRATK